MSVKTGLFIGRFQPFHEGHRRCIEEVLKANDRCIVMIRETEMSLDNPLTVQERWDSIRRAFPDSDRVIIRRLEDPGADLTVYIGREVGYELIRLDPAIEAIHATDLRRELANR